jgi:hypothetical protein
MPDEKVSFHQASPNTAKKTAFSCNFAARAFFNISRAMLFPGTPIRFQPRQSIRNLNHVSGRIRQRTTPRFLGGIVQCGTVIVVVREVSRKGHTMIYYSLGLITSTIVFSFFLAALRAPISGQYTWMVVFSLTFLSGATTLVFLIGLLLRMAQAVRQHHQTNEQMPSPPPALLSSSVRNVSPPERLPLSQSEFARHWIAQHEPSTEEVREDVPRGGDAIRHWLKNEIEKGASKKEKPDTYPMSGFESIKRH